MATATSRRSRRSVAGGPEGTLLDAGAIASAEITALQLAVPAVDPILRRLGRTAGPEATVLAPAHVSFGYPWLAPAEAADRIDAVTGALASAAPVEVELVGPRRFPPDRRGRVTVHLVPEPATPLHELAALIGGATDRPLDGFTPHCSLVRVRDEEDVTAVEGVVAGVVPIAARLTTVELRVRTHGSWSIARTVRLRG